MSMEPTHSLSAMRRRVMRRVYFMYGVRLFLRSASVKVGAVGVVFVAIASSVSLPNVVRNMPGNVFDAPVFFLSAFLETDVLVQVLVLAVFGFSLWLALDLLRSVARIVPLRA